jgi:hypothetical protein
MSASHIPLIFADPAGKNAWLRSVPHADVLVDLNRFSIDRAARISLNVSGACGVLDESGALLASSVVPVDPASVEGFVEDAFAVLTDQEYAEEEEEEGEDIDESDESDAIVLDDDDDDDDEDFEEEKQPKESIDEVDEDDESVGERA